MFNIHWSIKKHLPSPPQRPPSLSTVQSWGGATGQGLQQLLVALPQLKHLLALQGVRRSGLAKHQGLAQQSDNDGDAGL